ncbi:MAG: HAMP domain-containing sensor histidine kinase [Chloroflexota bacterium]
MSISFFSFPDLRPLSEDEVIAFRIFVVIITYSLLTVLFAYHLYLMQKSEQHNLELQKRAYTLALQRRLTANMAHDFRTPITNIKTKAYLVRKLYERGEDITERLIALDEQINQMQSMMEDLDNLNKLDSTNNIEVSKKQINIVPLITKTIETQRSFATARQIVLLAQLPDTPVNVEGSEKLLRELFKTLLENAIIYNKDNGTVTIELTTEQNKAIFTIEDTGIGISSQYHEQIFERFFRVNAARTIETNVGTGIGLTIAKFVAESHKGTIAVDSVPDKGTTFTVRLPLAKNMT